MVRLRRTVVVLTGIVTFITLAGVLTSPPAQAYPAFQKQFELRYLQRGSRLHSVLGEHSRCNVCHIGGSLSRKHRNAYGKALDYYLSRTDCDSLTLAGIQNNPFAARQALDRVRRAMAAVEEWPSVPSDRGSPTFGELIQAGKLPLSPKAVD